MSELRPFEECPRYAACSVNVCPLDPDQELRTVHKSDKELKCPMEKGVRMRIGSKYPELLPMGGLTRAEWGAAQAFAKKSLAEKQAMAQRGKVALAAIRAKKGQE